MFQDMHRISFSMSSLRNAQHRKCRKGCFCNGPSLTVGLLTRGDASVSTRSGNLNHTPDVCETKQHNVFLRLCPLYPLALHYVFPRLARQEPPTSAQVIPAITSQTATPNKCR